MPSQARADTRTPVRVGDVRSARRTFRTAPGVASGGLSVRRDCRPREGWRASVGLPSARRRASVAVRTAFPMGARSQRDRSDAARQRGSPSRLRDRGAPSIRPLHTRSVTLRWCDRSFRRNIREAPAIHGMPRDPVALKRVLLRNAPGKFVGDIDILFFNKSEPERAVAIEVKRIKVGPKAFLTNKPNEQCRRGDVSRYDKSVTSNCGQRDIGTRIGTTGGICRLELHTTDGPSAAHDR